MNPKNPLRHWLAGVLASAILGIMQFIIVTIVCVVQLPRKHIPEDGYFLSDLGRSVLPLSGLFNGSLIGLGILLIPMFIMLVRVDTRQSFSLRVATLFGIVSSMGLVFLGCSPVDKAYVSHLLATAMWVFPMLYMVIAFYASATRSHYVNVWFIGASLIMAVAMLIVCGSIWMGFIIWFLALEGYGVIAEWEPTAIEKIDHDSQLYFQTLAVKKSSHDK